MYYPGAGRNEADAATEFHTTLVGSQILNVCHDSHNI
jgi:hypothetical protein